VTLAPEESALAVQRLVFGAADYYDWRKEREMSFKRAVYGQTQLPKGVIANGREVAFDGRSHNVLLVSSHWERGSCPFVQSWCEIREEWVLHGKMLVGYAGAANAAADSRDFQGFRSRLRLVEREHERTHITSASLDIFFADGTSHRLLPEVGITDDAPLMLDIGDSAILDFALPLDLSAADVLRSTLHLYGWYDLYNPHVLAQQLNGFVARP
jgi:hypothetical protein